MNLPTIKIEKLFVYPIKSCHGVEVNSLQLGRNGLKNDRIYMLVDNRGLFVTQRQYPKLATVHTSLAEGNVEVRSKGRPPITIYQDETDGEAFEGMIWKEKVLLVEASAEASQWFSEFLATPVRLVKLDKPSGRQKAKESLPNPYHVSFPDSSPIMLANIETVEDLARQAGVTIPFQRFRPNILISGAQAWSEDQWTSAKVGGLHFPLAYRCDRCIVITIDQEQGEKGREPLATLSQLRRGDQLSFGLRMVHQGSGVIRTGDHVVPMS